MKNKYEYQDIAAQKVLDASLTRMYKGAVLASAPNSGKTTISHKILNAFFEKFPSATALVITHGQGVLKDQYLSDLKKPNVDISFTYGDLNSGNQVEVCLFQNHNKIDKQYDLVIVDEAHQFYNAEISDKMLSKVKNKYLILMTGTPSFFNKWNQQNSNKYFVHYVSSSEADNNSHITVDFVKTFSDKIDHTVQATITKMKEYDCSKVIIACSSTREAAEVARLLVGRNVAISTASDKQNENIRSFVEGKFDTLIVVNKGILGFNDPNITLAIDFKASMDIDVTYQFLARVLRKHPDNKQKTYLRVVNKAEWNKNVTVLKQVTALFNKKEFSTYTSKKVTYKAPKESMWKRVIF